MSTPTKHDINELLRTLLNKAHVVGQDDYREGASDRSVERHYNEMELTREALNTALASVLADAERYKALERAHAGQPWEEFTTIMIAEYIHSKPGYEHVACTLAELADRLREGAK